MYCNAKDCETSGDFLRVVLRVRNTQTQRIDEEMLADININTYDQNKWVTTSINYEIDQDSANIEVFNKFFLTKYTIF